MCMIYDSLNYKGHDEGIRSYVKKLKPTQK